MLSLVSLASVSQPYRPHPPSNAPSAPDSAWPSAAYHAVDAESGKWTARGGHSSKAEDDDPLAGGASNTSSAMWGNCSPETAHRSGTDLLGVTGGGKNEDIPAEFETMFASPRSEKGI